MSEVKTAAADPHASAKEMVTDVFVRGARQGWGIAIGSMLPNVLMAFVIIKALQITGLLKLIGIACGPVMAVFGLPGEAAPVLLAAWGLALVSAFLVPSPCSVRVRSTARIWRF